MTYIADIYVRLSKEDTSDSIENQKAVIEGTLLHYPEIRIHAVREDDGYTGTNFFRPGFQQVIQDITDGKIDCLVVKDLSRIGRNYLQVGAYVQDFFPKNGIRLIAIQDGYDSLDAAPMERELLLPIKNLMNDAYSRDLSIKIRTGLESKRRSGVFVGAFAPFGYTKSEDGNQLIIEEESATIVRQIFSYKIKGMSQGQIAHKLQENHVPSPLEHKHRCGSNYTCNFQGESSGRWHPQSVTRILKNEVYIGNLVQGIRKKVDYRSKNTVVRNQKEWIRTLATHAPIIQTADYHLVQELLSRDTRISPREKKAYPLSGKLFCGNCQGTMVRKTVTSQSGRGYTYYVCGNHKRNGEECRPNSISQPIIMKILGEELGKLGITIEEVNRLLDYIIVFGDEKKMHIQFRFQHPIIRTLQEVN